MTDFTSADLIVDTANAKKSPVIAPFETSETYLTRRFERPARATGEIVYELSNDPGYLHQYYRLREEMFIRVWGLQHFSGQIDPYDDKSDVMIARIGNHVIGGCRLTFSDRAGRKHLPMEKDDFILQKLMPEMPLSNVLYAEISRMAILPEYQNSLVMLELIRQLLIRGADRQARYAFTLAPVALARNYRKATSLFGLKWHMRYDIPVPDREEYEGIRMVLSVLDLEPAYKHRTKPVVDIDAPVTLVAG